MKIIGLTGGIGSGKSTVARYLREEGIPVIDADEAGHGLLADDAVIRQRVVDAFGVEVMDGGQLSRERLAARVFNDEDARIRLNTILHPAIIDVVTRRCVDYFRQGHPVVVVEAALLGEGGKKEPWLEGLILVLAGAQHREHRLAEFRGMDASESRRRMASQAAPESKEPIADWLIDNNGDLDALRRQVRVLAEALRRLQE